MMKLSVVSFLLATAASVQGFVPSIPTHAMARFVAVETSLSAKYNKMEEILALFPGEKPILVNFYDAATEKDIKDDIFRAKTLLKDRATVVSVKQQDYPEIAKLWDCDKKTPSMILFKDGSPVTRIYEQSFYLDIVAKVGQYCRPEGEEHKPFSA
jgi:hypothetical protein